MIKFTLNGTPTQLDVPPETPLLWAIREQPGSPARSSAAVECLRRLHGPRRRRRLGDLCVTGCGRGRQVRDDD